MPPIQFILSSALDSLVDDVYNAVFSVKGQLIYQTRTPIKISQRVTTIKRLNKVPLPTSPSLTSAEVKELEAKGEEPPPPSYEQVVAASDKGEGGAPVEVGEIEFHEFSPSIFRYDGKTVDEHQMFMKSSFLNSLLAGDRKFKAPDGHTYIWYIGLEGMELARKHEDDKNTTVVATWNPRRFGIVHVEPMPPCLEILPEAQHMIDLIFLTFIFVHYQTHK